MVWLVAPMFGALFGLVLLFIPGAIVGCILGGIIGAALGFIDSIVLIAVISRYYVPPDKRSIFRPLMYGAAILTNMLTLFLLFGGLALAWASMPLTIEQAFVSVITTAGIPALMSGLAAAYFCGGFLEYVDAQMGFGDAGQVSQDGGKGVIVG